MYSKENVLSFIDVFIEVSENMLTEFEIDKLDKNFRLGYLCAIKHFKVGRQILVEKIFNDTEGV